MFCDLVGLPWSEKGLSRDGVNCWGLYRLAWHALTGRWLPTYDDAFAGVEDRDEIHQLFAKGRAGWTTVPPGKERRGDAVLMVIAGLEHVGMVVRPGLMLHIPAGGSSCIEAYDGSRYAASVRRGGFYRHEG